jgi:hypothetical protein
LLMGVFRGLKAPAPSGRGNGNGKGNSKGNSNSRSLRYGAESAPPVEMTIYGWCVRRTSNGKCKLPEL